MGYIAPRYITRRKPMQGRGLTVGHLGGKTGNGALLRVVPGTKKPGFAGRVIVGRGGATLAGRYCGRLV
jgi:hypothetical protein